MNWLWRQLAVVTNWPVLLAVAVLSALGVAGIWVDQPGSHADAKKQMLFLAVAVVGMVLFQAVNYQRIGRLAWPFYILSLLLVAYTVLAAAMYERYRLKLPGVHEIKGTYAWINLGAMSLEPSELAKVSFVLVLARYLRFRSNYRTFWGLLPPFLLALAPLVLILKQPDLGMAMVFVPALFAMLFVAGARAAHLLAIMGIGVALVPLMWFSGTCDRHGADCPICPCLPVVRHLPQFVKHYQRARVYALLSDDPAVLKEGGYQQERARIAMGSGGAWGKGFNNVPVGRTVPEAHNDMIFALIGEQFGLLGSAVVLGAYMVLFAAGIEIASATREPFGRLVALGLVALLAAQTFINLGVCMRLMPVTGITLPFISYGGSSLLSSFMAVGLLLNIGQHRPLVMARESFEF